MSTHVHQPLNSKHSPKPRARVAKPRTASSKASHSRQVDVDTEQMAKAQVAAREAARQAEIAREAYFRAERRGFAPGYELDDWLAAEAAVNGDGTAEVLSTIDDPVGERHSAPDVTPVR
jgi:Protein of unknown function (DUF2934)